MFSVYNSLCWQTFSGSWTDTPFSASPLSHQNRKRCAVCFISIVVHITALIFNIFPLGLSSILPLYHSTFRLPSLIYHQFLFVLSEPRNHTSLLLPLERGCLNHQPLRNRSAITLISFGLSLFMPPYLGLHISCLKLVHADWYFPHCSVVYARCIYICIDLAVYTHLHQATYVQAAYRTSKKSVVLTKKSCPTKRIIQLLRWKKKHNLCK